MARSGKKTKETVPSQRMTNSPGGIQAGGNVMVTSDRRVISSIVLYISMEADTSPSKPTEIQTDAGLESALALFTRDKTRIRFVTDFMVRDQQVTETCRRLTFVYTPETPGQILGKPIDFLASVEELAVNYADIFATERFDTTRANTRFHCSVFVNGVTVATISGEVKPAGALASGQANWNVSNAFSRIPTNYSSTVSR